MFNPSELDGEVDHSFFDSDCADSSGDGGKKTEKGLKAEKESRAANETLHAKHAEIARGDHSPRTERTRKQLKQVENNNNSSRAGRKERHRASSISSVSVTSDKAISDSSESEDGSNLHSKKPSGTFMALLAEARDVDDTDAYNQSPNESEEEALAFKASTKKRNKKSPKKLLRNRCSRSPSPTSSDTSADADPESSYSSSSRRSSSSNSSSSSSSSLESPTLSRPNKSSLCAGVRESSSGSQDLPNIHAEESDDRMTDVSPLSSNDISPLQSLDVNHTGVEKESHKEEQQQQQQQESVPSSGLSNRHEDEDSDPDVEECSLRLESQLESNLVLRCPGGRNRKNFSFTNDEVRRIDRENQRLLRELSRLSPGPRPGSVVKKKTHKGSKSPLIRLSHSALNRQREQQRIERENLAFLKRLESVKPTPGLGRSEQMADYQRQVGYLGAPSYPISGARPVSSRAASAITDSSSTPLPRSKKLSAARPAWC